MSNGFEVHLLKMRDLKDDEVFSVWQHNGYESDSLLGLYISFGGAVKKFYEEAKVVIDQIGESPISRHSGVPVLEITENIISVTYNKYDSYTIEIEKINP